jgi:hypothetical protein
MRTIRTYSISRWWTPALLMLVVLTVLALQPPTATAQQASHPADSGFSFAVYGDSRSMMYLPYKQDEEPQARASWSICSNW